MASADVAETEDGTLQQAGESSQSAKESSNPAVEVPGSQSPKDKSKSKKTKDKTKEKSKKSSEKTSLKAKSEEQIPDYRWDHGTSPKSRRKDLRRSGSLGNISVKRSTTPKIKKAASLRRLSVDDAKTISPSKSTDSSGKSTLSSSKSKKSKTPTDSEASAPSASDETKAVTPSKSTVSSGKSTASASKSKKTKTPPDTVTSALSAARKTLESEPKESPLKTARRLRRAGSALHLVQSTKPKVKRTSSADGLSKLRKSLKGKKSPSGSDALKSSSYHCSTSSFLESGPDYRWDKPDLSKSDLHRSRSDVTGYSRGGPNRVRFSLESNHCIEVPRCTKEEKSELFYSKKEIKVFKSEDQQRKQKNAMEKLQRQAAAADMTSFGTTIGNPIATSC